MNTVDASKSRQTSLRGSVALFAVCALLIPGGVGCDWVGPRTYRVPTGAMLPTIKVGQTIVVMRLPGGATGTTRATAVPLGRFRRSRLLAGSYSEQRDLPPNNRLKQTARGRSVSESLRCTREAAYPGRE